MDDSFLVNNPQCVALSKASQLISGDRLKTNGNPLIQFESIADAWNAYLYRLASAQGKFPLTLAAHDVANLMVMFKMIRAAGDHLREDNYVDAAGYASIGFYLAEKASPDE